MHASLMGFCLESLVIDNDMLGQFLRCVRGVTVSDESLSLDIFRDVCIDGPGHYLGHKQTLALMQSEYVYPDLANRSSPKEWEEQGKPVLISEAAAKVAAILGQGDNGVLDAKVDAHLCEKFDLLLG